MSRALVHSNARLVTCAVVCVLAIPLAACDRRAPDAIEQRPASAIGGSFPQGTVGHAASNYILTMSGVRAWYAVMRRVRDESERAGVGLSLDFPLDSRLDDAQNRVDSLPVLRAVLKEHGLASAEFVVLTTAVGALRVSLALTDSLGPGGRPQNIGESVLDFARLHRVEIDSLESTLTRE
jgi:hypothetical protein